jgi:hypothetical protein
VPGLPARYAAKTSGATRLDDVAAQRARDGPSLALGAHQMFGDAADIIGGQLAGQAHEPIADAYFGADRPAEVVMKDFRGTRFEFVGLQRTQIERRLAREIGMTRAGVFGAIATVHG